VPHLVLAQHAALVPADCVVVNVDLAQAAHHVQLVVGAAVAFVLGALGSATATAESAAADDDNSGKFWK
jgi:hypothetical protein